jgi:hypothetical protein
LQSAKFIGEKENNMEDWEIKMQICCSSVLKLISFFMRPSRDGPYYVIGYGGQAGVHTGLSDLYQTWPHDSPVEGEEPYLFWGH